MLQRNIATKLRFYPRGRGKNIAATKKPPLRGGFIGRSAREKRPEGTCGMADHEEAKLRPAVASVKPL